MLPYVNSYVGRSSYRVAVRRRGRSTNAGNLDDVALSERESVVPADRTKRGCVRVRCADCIGSVVVRSRRKKIRSSRIIEKRRIRNRRETESRKPICSSRISYTRTHTVAENHLLLKFSHQGVYVFFNDDSELKLQGRYVCVLMISVSVFDLI